VTADEDPGQFDATACTTIPQVIARMKQIDAALPRNDGVAYFNRLYLQVTLAVDAATAGVTFKQPGFAEQLDVVFAALYFAAEETIRTGGECPVAWRPLVEERSTDRAPIQFAIAGMNAHIDHDLPIAVVKTCEQLNLTPANGSAAHADYQSVNGILGKVEGQVAGWYEQGLIADIVDIDAATKDVSNALAMWSIVDARNAAWSHARHLWNLRHVPALADLYCDMLARLVELSSRGILI
jgi:hypothetical protein